MHSSAVVVPLVVADVVGEVDVVDVGLVVLDDVGVDVKVDDRVLVGDVVFDDVCVEVSVEVIVVDSVVDAVVV